MKKIIITLVITMILAFSFMPQKETPLYIHQPAPDINMIKVEIVGPFPYAGTYHFFEPITVLKALSFAGIPFEPIDDSNLVYSELITRDRTLHIHGINDEVDHPQVLVNINQASFKELIEIPYMTESRAASLIIYRETHGPFLSIDDLIHVKYIGSVTLENLRPYITLS